MGTNFTRLYVARCADFRDRAILNWNLSWLIFWLIQLFCGINTAQVPLP
jgi:hypothetical protein